MEKSKNEKRKEELAKITSKLEEGVKEVFNSEQYQKFLDTIAKFPRYSARNCLLILMQNPFASYVQSYTGWKKMGRYVKKGEKGIRILAPSPFKARIQKTKKDSDGRAVLDKKGKEIKETVVVDCMSYRVVSTFDISQTEGEPLPPRVGVEELEGVVRNYDLLFSAITKTSPFPLVFKNIENGSKGCCSYTKSLITIKEGMSEIQTIKTAIHEIAHAKLHNQSMLKDTNKSVETKEIEAESVAYTVCKYLGIETSDYSFSYIADWSKEKDLKELSQSLDIVRDASAEIISKIDETMAEAKKQEERPLTA